MNKYPEWLQVGDKKYKINTSFRIALRCDEIFRDDTICDYEKTLAIIYLLLGEDAVKDIENQEQIVKLLTKYFLCGKNPEDIDRNYMEIVLPEKMVMNLEYIKQFHFFYDLKIMFKTIADVF